MTLTYYKIIALNNVLVEMADLPIDAGSADLYLSIHKNVKHLNDAVNIFNEARDTAIKDINNEDEKNSIITDLLSQEVEIELWPLTYTDLECFNGITIQNIAALDPILVEWR